MTWVPVKPRRRQCCKQAAPTQTCAQARITSDQEILDLVQRTTPSARTPARAGATHSQPNMMHQLPSFATTTISTALVLHTVNQTVTGHATLLKDPQDPRPPTYGRQIQKREQECNQVRMCQADMSRKQRPNIIYDFEHKEFCSACISSTAPLMYVGPYHVLYSAIK